MNKEISFRQSQPLFNETFVGTFDFKQDGFLYAISPAMAVQVSPQIYIGATLNLWDNIVDRNGWESVRDELVSGMFAGDQFKIRNIKKESNSFEGTNVNLGFLWMINDSFTLGGVYKAAFDADLVRTTVKRYVMNIPPNDLDVTTEEKENLVLKMPASYGLGLSYRHSDNWTIAIDVYRTEWSKTLIRDEDGEERLITDRSSAEKGRLKDTTQVRLGTEYLFIREKDVIPIRLGLFYDPEPQKDHLDEYYGFSFGTGYAQGRIVVDISYQYRRGRNLTGDLPLFPGSSVDLDQHTFMSSLIIYFSD
jgi:long-subunit fatty acid transport protein